MKYQLVLFDLDGTILYTLEDLMLSLNTALKLHSLPTRTLDEVRRFVGNGIHKLIERAVPAGTSTELTEQVFADFTAHYTVHCADHTRPYDGILELLQTLRTLGCRTAVVSNKADPAVQILCNDYFPGLFDAVVGERPGVRKKPAPDSVNAVLQQLHIEREHAVYVGDSDVDIQTAQNAGMRCLSVDWGFRSREELLAAGASTLLSHPSELLPEII